MKRILASIALAIGAGLLATLPPAARAGLPVPSYELKLLDGSTLASAGLAGKVVIVTFWATWCAPCRAELPQFDAYYRKHRDEGLELIAVSVDDPRDRQKVKNLAKPFAFTVALHEESRLEDFGDVLPLPKTFVIDRAGLLRKKGWTAAPYITVEMLEQVVSPLLSAPATPR